MTYLLQHTQSCLMGAAGENLWGQYGSDATIILTHPNLWDNDQHEFLRKAAIKAGLISKERANFNLHFVEEAEAASRYYVSRFASNFDVLRVSHN